MAKPEAPKPEAAEPPKKSRKKLLLILSLVIAIFLVGGGGAAYMMLKGHDEADSEEDEEVVVKKEKPAKKKAEKEAPPVYAGMDAFTINLTPENGEQYLQLVLSVEMEDIQAADKLKAYTPKIRNQIMLLLSGKKASELLPKEGKEKLAADIRALLNGILSPGGKAGSGPVKEVLFTSFIIQ